MRRYPTDPDPVVPKCDGLTLARWGCGAREGYGCGLRGRSSPSLPRSCNRGRGSRDQWRWRHLPRNDPTKLPIRSSPMAPWQDGVELRGTRIRPGVEGAAFQRRAVPCQEDRWQTPLCAQRVKNFDHANRWARSADVDGERFTPELFHHGQAPGAPAEAHRAFDEVGAAALACPPSGARSMRWDRAPLPPTPSLHGAAFLAIETIDALPIHGPPLRPHQHVDPTVDPPHPLESERPGSRTGLL